MNYKIDGRVIFREDDGKLWNIYNPEQFVRLSVIPARIFNYLIQNSTKIVNRNELLENIWDKNGLQASNNSLSQNISILRKILLDFGCESDIILTLPKVGFRINESTIIEVENDVIKEHTNTDVVQNALSQPMRELSKKSHFKIAALVVSILASIVITAILLQFIKDENDIIIPNAKLHYIGKVEGCTIYTLNQVSAEFIGTSIKLVTDLINKHLPCKENASFIFQPDDHYIHNHSGRVFLSRCIPSTVNGNSFSSCQDLYIYEH
ncbi:winged helix-turn-helix domain-containing protein (plasmid) [Hafnia alvei]|uniref:winged helix-turn-helix domain-containing protein n=1 Tax=Hafnia alvei TaxID=569 RepID=UPI0028BE89C5|nr:winged helix-turn-helix domain-containing protein [Hafnia alvei]WNN54673.1 winged helix-turn-helix domain-containing protein [Hafnia alvei]